MKAAVLVSARTIEMQDRPMPEPGAGEVRVKLAAVGVCGSDVHYYAHGRIGSAEVQYPTLLGHEPSGVIDKAGEGVTLAEGTRVAVEPANPCGKCETCISGKRNACPNVKFLGTPPIDGIYEQYHIMPEHCCIPIPDNVSLVEAALMEPLGVGLHAVELADLKLGETVAIFGSGPIGMVTLLSAKAAGASKVYMTDLVPERLNFAKEMGADEVFDASKGDAVQWIKELTGGRGVDATFEAAGKPETIMHACRAARICGRALMIGIPEGDGMIPFPMHEIRRRELEIQNVRRSNWEILRCLDLVASGRINLKPLATHLYPLEKVQDALEQVLVYGDGVVRAIIQPNEDLAEK